MYAKTATLQASRESHRVSKEPIAKDVAEGLIASVLLPPNPLTASLRAKISSFIVATTKFRCKCSVYDSWRPASGLGILGRVLNVRYWTHLSYQPNVRCQQKSKLPCASWRQLVDPPFQQDCLPGVRKRAERAERKLTQSSHTAPYAQSPLNCDEIGGPEHLAVDRISSELFTFNA